MQEHPFFPTTPKITVSASDEMIGIIQYWSQLGGGLEDAHIQLPRPLFIPFLEVLFARMDIKEIAQAQKACQMWQDIITDEEQEALKASKSKTS